LVLAVLNMVLCLQCFMHGLTMRLVALLAMQPVSINGRLA
jgi:hypothetical protein